MPSAGQSVSLAVNMMSSTFSLVTMTPGDSGGGSGSFSLFDIDLRVLPGEERGLRGVPGMMIGSPDGDDQSQNKHWLRKVEEWKLSQHSFLLVC